MFSDHNDIIEEGHKLLLNRKVYQHDDAETWQGFFDKFTVLPSEMNNALLKYIFWIRVARTKKDYNILENQVGLLASNSNDVCPVFGTPLDYGVGKNKVTNSQNPNTWHHSFYQPTVDHIIAKSQCKKYGGWRDYDPDQIENYILVSEAANTCKNKYFSSDDQLEQFYLGMKKTYFSGGGK